MRDDQTSMLLIDKKSMRAHVATEGAITWRRRDQYNEHSLFTLSPLYAFTG